MTQNEFYQPAFVGGVIRGVQVTLENYGANSVSCASRNGVYYVYNGEKFQLLSLDGVTVAVDTKELVSKELHDYTAIPSSDIKLMVDTAGLEGLRVTVQILWGV